MSNCKYVNFSLSVGYQIHVIKLSKETLILGVFLIVDSFEHHKC